MSKHTLPRHILEKFQPHPANGNTQSKARWPEKPGPAIGYRERKDGTYEQTVLGPKKVLFPNGLRIWSYWYQHPWLTAEGRIRANAIDDSKL